jgi:hypothetical protein
MKRNKSSRELSIVLALVNVLALLYPINLFLRAKSVDENLFATFVLIASVFLLALLDAISIVTTDAVGTGKQR